MKNARKIRAKMQRDVYSYRTLYAASSHALEQAKSSAETRDCYYNCMSAMLYSALAIEAYLNHLGSEVFTGHWKDLERMKTREKLIVLSRLVGLEVDRSRRPFQTFDDIQTFRNALVHAQTEHLRGEWPDNMAAHWEKAGITLETAECFVADTEAMILELARASGREIPQLSLMPVWTMKLDLL